MRQPTIARRSSPRDTRLENSQRAPNLSLSRSRAHFEIEVSSSHPRCPPHITTPSSSATQPSKVHDSSGAARGRDDHRLRGNDADDNLVTCGDRTQIAGEGTNDGSSNRTRTVHATRIPGRTRNNVYTSDWRKAKSFAAVTTGVVGEQLGWGGRATRAGGGRGIE